MGRQQSGERCPIVCKASDWAVKQRETSGVLLVLTSQALLKKNLNPALKIFEASGE